MEGLFKDIYKNKTVFVTGHTGFKGSWLVLWLKELGAKVVGYSLEPPTEPNHFELLNLNITSVIGDIRDRDKLRKVFEEYQPHIVFHLAAQSLVRYSYEEPAETFETNVIGTINVFESCRICDSVKAVINVTSDKCYENREWIWGYRESDLIGGFDPYSCSKGCSELVTSAYRRSFFNLDEYGQRHNVLLASVRSGNVIGGGDWGNDRIVPDLVKAACKDEKAKVRNPHSVRPWQFVLEPLSGYLRLGQLLLKGKKQYAEAWNFGPCGESIVTVKEAIEKMKSFWAKINYQIEEIDDFHEANMLKLDSSKAFTKLKWNNVWGSDQAFEETAKWYKSYYEENNVLSRKMLELYINDAVSKKLAWTL